MGTSFTCFPDRGSTAPPVSHSRRWSFWKSWLPSCPCRVPTLSATEAVWRHIASCGPQSSRHRASRVWRGMRRRRKPRIGAGPGCSGACLIWLWRPVFRHCVGRGKRADALRRRSRARPCDLPWGRRGSLRSIAPIPQAAVSTRIRRHLTLAAVPPPSAPARWRQALCACAAPHDRVRGLVGDGRTAEASLPPLRASRVPSSPLPSSAFPEPLAPGQPL